MNFVRVRVPASSANLGPGFDTLGLALNLFNFVSLGESPDAHDQVTASGEGAGLLPPDETNIALRAARDLLRELGAPPVAIALHLDNNIPLARGLGSSAAARVGAIVAANEWARQSGWGEASGAQLLNLATRLEGHPDNVAAALLGGLVVSAQTDAGAVASRVRVERFPSLCVWIPDAELETKTARAALPDAVFRQDASFNIARAALLVAALAGGDWDVLPEALRDRLHQDHRAPLMPGFNQICRAAREAGAFGATLSGAGPTILAWLPREPGTRGVMDAMQEAAQRAGVAGRALEVEVDEPGCAVL